MGGSMRLLLRCCKNLIGEEENYVHRTELIGYKCKNVLEITNLSFNKRTGGQTLEVYLDTVAKTTHYERKETVTSHDFI